MWRVRHQLNAAIADLRALTGRNGVPILATVERNRATMTSDGQHAGAGTRKIEFGAASVLAIDRKEGDQENTEGDVPVTLKISKNRHGAPGKKISMRWNGALQRFAEN